MNDFVSIQELIYRHFARAVAFMVGKRGGGSTISQQLTKLLFTKGASQNKFQKSFPKTKRMVCCSKFGEKIYQKRNHHALF